MSNLHDSRNRPHSIPLPFIAAGLLWGGAALSAVAQVQSLTLGINVNSPYGIREPWVAIRDGLQRLEFVEAMSPQPDAAAATGEMRTRHGQMPDLDLLARALVDTGAGASLRGVEASVAGELGKEGDTFVLRLTGPGTVLRLQPLTALVQRGAQATAKEKAAYRTLTANWTGRPLRVTMVGPVHQSPEKPADALGAKALTLEVRRFTLRP